ncbi:MAG: hypothetical protein ACRC4W_01095 [Treponemataceae bacterium]
MNQKVFFFNSIFFIFILISQTLSAVTLEDYNKLSLLYTEFSSLEKTESETEALHQKLLEYFSLFSKCLKDSSAADKLQLYALGESFFFITHIYNSQIYLESLEKFSNEIKAIQSEVENFLISYFPKKTGAELYFISQIPSEKRQILQIDFNLPPESFVPKPIDIPFLDSFKSLSETEKKIHYYRTFEQASELFPQYGIIPLTTFIENPYLLFTASNASFNFENQSKFIEDFQNYVKAEKEQTVYSNASEPYAKYSSFAGFTIPKKNITQMGDEAAQFYHFNAYLKGLDAFCMQYGIALTTLFSEKSAQYLKKILSSDLFLLFLYQNPDIEKNYQKITAQYNVISHFAERYHKIKYNIAN